MPINDVLLHSWYTSILQMNEVDDTAEFHYLFTFTTFPKGFLLLYTINKLHSLLHFSVSSIIYRFTSAVSGEAAFRTTKKHSSWIFCHKNVAQKTNLILVPNRCPKQPVEASLIPTLPVLNLLVYVFSSEWKIIAFRHYLLTNHSSLLRSGLKIKKRWSKTHSSKFWTKLTTAVIQQ